MELGRFKLWRQRTETYMRWYLSNKRYSQFAAIMSAANILQRNQISMMAYEGMSHLVFSYVMNPAMKMQTLV